MFTFCPRVDAWPNGKNAPVTSIAIHLGKCWRLSLLENASSTVSLSASRLSGEPITPPTITSCVCMAGAKSRFSHHSTMMCLASAVTGSRAFGGVQKSR